jgi:D-alanyl-D-alanine dipeptidase
MAFDYAGRISRAGRETASAGLDGLIVTPSADLIYLAGYDPPPLERLTALLLRPGHDPILVVPELERPRAAATTLGELVEMVPWRDGDDPYDAVSRLLEDQGTYGATDTMWAVHVLGLQQALPEAKFVTGSGVVSMLRRRKDEGEVQMLARAARSADETFRRVTREGLEGKTEAQVAKALSSTLVETGHDEALFWIVGSGPNGASPHHDSGQRGIRAGDAVVLDFGGRMSGYCSDMTRTVSVGDPSEELKDVHEIVRRAQEAAFEAVRPGVPAEEVDRAARRVIEEAGYGQAFIHRTGHGIGLDEHEPPYLVEGNTELLEAGMCFSIEPGIYLQGRLGVRIEDIVTVTEDGAARLNHAPRELTVL